jgi:hypothetical protein
MICPDVDLFIQALEEGRVPQELEAHMELCPVCRKMWWVLKNASPRPYPEEPLSERMMQAGLRGIEAGRQEEERRARRVHVPLAGLIGFVATAALLFFSGAGGSNANLTTLLLASGVVGVASALYRLRWGFKPRRSHRRETPSAPG